MYALHTLGQKQYELNDHLGDVLATISDKRRFGQKIAWDKAGTLHAGSQASIESWSPIVVSASDYYPFGMLEEILLAEKGICKFMVYKKMENMDGRIQG